ncbi:polyprenol monophosphomannose synthase [Humibacter ginsenosidimutans]|uniref:Polyprenol monophosphomannose synthase n=1 Tax=Humibacter ginsenosidimutans TaxID=2599293 RepID=A0A5B8M657_9MICO|nr:polyprenol monophosphomannose synthase [Humibacter ginsenosidimutans]QDZ15661.1 polyprenol monophosphomannose synthase [Humibacter ginsenosidimutans]
MNAVVIIPTYNEAQNIAWIVGRVRNAVPDASVLIVDDGSPDGTGELADGLAANDAAVAVLHRAGKEGLGAAYRAGMRWALERGHDVIVEMDADGSHRPEDLPPMLAALDKADVIVGSRWVPGGGVVGWPLYRKAISRVGSAYARFALGVPVRDMTGGYRVFTADALERIDLDAVLSQGYCFQIDMLWHAQVAGLRIREVPITFPERERGNSKMSGAIVLEAMLRVTGWAVGSLPARMRRAAGKQQAAAGVR